MTPNDVAKRLSVPVASVLAVATLPATKHSDGGHVATLAGGERVLVSATTARRYVPEVDGQLDEPATATEPDEPDAEVPAPTMANPGRTAPAKRAPRKVTRGGAK